MDKKVIKNIVKISAGVLVILAVWWLFSSHRLDGFTPAAARDYIQKFGKWGAVVYVLAYVLNTISILPPIAVLSLAAGLAFGKVWGAVLLMGGAMLGTSITFFISRFIGRDFVQRHLRGKFKNLDDLLEKRGFMTILFFRAIPLLPYEVFNYVSGLSRIRFRDYFFASFLGFIPGVVISAYFGGTLGEVKGYGDLLSFKFILAIIVLFLAILVPVIYQRIKRKGDAYGN